MQMAHAQHFNEFLLEFQEGLQLFIFTDDMHVGMILSDGSVEIRRVLPIRLEKAQKLCKKYSHDYATSCGFIMAHDDCQHEVGLPDETIVILAIKKGSHPKIRNTDPLDDPLLFGVVKWLNCEIFVTHLHNAVSAHVVNLRNLMLGSGVMKSHILQRM